MTGRAQMMSTLRRLALVWIGLLLLLVLTLGASMALTGAASLAASLAIAFGKAGLVYWFFMNIREEDDVGRISALAPIAWLLVFVSLLAADYGTRS